MLMEDKEGNEVIFHTLYLIVGAILLARASCLLVTFNLLISEYPLVLVSHCSTRTRVIS